MFLWKQWYIFSRIPCWIESSKEQNWFQIELFCKIINAFIVSFDQIKIIIKNKNLTDPKLILNSSKIVFIILLLLLLLLLLSASDGYSKDEPVTHFY